MVDRVGQRLDNYRLSHLLGAGSFGQVHLAQHIYRETQVAIKVLPQLAEGDLPDFLNEARTIRLRHPHIVQILDFGVDNRIPFIVMEYIANGTLQQRYPKGSQLPLDRIVLYGNQVADALQCAHTEKLIHRDVKPENMLLRSDKEVLLSDFGIATFARSSVSQSILEMAGTITSMAPEQLQGRPVLASDQYALGVVVYEWLCGERPFKGSPMEIATQHMLKPVPPLREKIPDVPLAQQQAVLMALEKELKKRFPSVQAFAYALEQATRVEPSRDVASQYDQPTTPPVTSFTVEDFSFNVASFPSRLPSPTILLPDIPVQTFAKSLSQSPPSLFIPNPSSSRTIFKRQKQTKHSYMFYPALLVLALLMVTTGGVGIFNFLRSNDSQAANQALDAAQQQMIRASSESSPSAALKTLATAQMNLAYVQKSYQLDDAQMQRLDHLQHDLVSHVQQAIIVYNQEAKIRVLPGTCTIHPIQNTSTNTSPESMVFADGSTSTPFLYTLGLDNHVYRIDDHYGMVSPLPSNKNTSQFSSMASNGSLLVLIQKQGNGSAQATYTLAVYQPGQQGTLSAPIASAPIGANMTRNGFMPVFITAWKNTVHVVLTSPTEPGNTHIVRFALDSKNRLSTPKESRFSISAPLVSIAAFPSQLFLLLSNGDVQSLSLATSSLPMPVLVQSQIALPLETSVKNFNVTTPVPKVAPIESSVSTPLSIPSTTQTNPATLTASQINGVPHLYIGDSANYRVLDLESSPTGTLTPTSTGTTGTTNSVKLQLDQQFVSYADFKQLKSITMDQKSDQLAVLSQISSSMSNLIAIQTGTQNGGPGNC